MHDAGQSGAVHHQRHASEWHTLKLSGQHITARSPIDCVEHGVESRIGEEVEVQPRHSVPPNGLARGVEQRTVSPHDTRAGNQIRVREGVRYRTGKPVGWHLREQLGCLNRICKTTNGDGPGTRQLYGPLTTRTNGQPTVLPLGQTHPVRHQTMARSVSGSSLNSSVVNPRYGLSTWRSQDWL